MITINWYLTNLYLFFTKTIGGWVLTSPTFRVDVPSKSFKCLFSVVFISSNVLYPFVGRPKAVITSQQSFISSISSTLLRFEDIFEVFRNEYGSLIMYLLTQAVCALRSHCIMVEIKNRLIYIETRLSADRANAWWYYGNQLSSSISDIYTDSVVIFAIVMVRLRLSMLLAGYIRLWVLVSHRVEIEKGEVICWTLRFILFTIFVKLKLKLFSPGLE